MKRVAQRFAASDLFYGHGTLSPWDEAAALVLGVTGLPDHRDAAHTRLEPDLLDRIDQLAARRIDERIPLGYLLGKVTYAGHEFLIEPGVVIPRSPIAQLIESGFRPWLHPGNRLATVTAGNPAAIADVCCGCGCLGILCALQFPWAQITLIDVDPAAVDLARRNVRLHDLEDRVTVVESDLFAALPGHRWDLIVTNPPYVDAPDLRTLPPEYRHEPVLGLAGGVQGLDVVERLVDVLGEHLEAEGLFVCEVGASSPALLRRYPQMPFIWPDLPAGGEGVFLLEQDRRP